MLAPHPIPYYDFLITIEALNIKDKSDLVSVNYLLSDFLLAAMFTRIVLLVRSVFNYTVFTDLYSRRLW